MTLRPRVASSARDCEDMRVIRNSCREFMTRDTTEISAERQASWWAVRDVNKVRTYLFDIADVAVGYGLIRTIDMKLWLSGGLVPDQRGHGLGAELFKHLCDTAESSCWLEVRSDNYSAVAIYEGLGFKLVSHENGITTMANGVVVTPINRAPEPAPASVPAPGPSAPPASYVTTPIHLPGPHQVPVLNKELFVPYRRPRKV